MAGYTEMNLPSPLTWGPVFWLVTGVIVTILHTKIINGLAALQIKFRSTYTGFELGGVGVALAGIFVILYQLQRHAVFWPKAVPLLVGTTLLGWVLVLPIATETAVKRLERQATRIARRHQTPKETSST